MKPPIDPDNPAERFGRIHLALDAKYGKLPPRQAVWMRRKRRSTQPPLLTRLFDRIGVWLRCIAAVLLVSGCAGTVVEMDGTICGQPVKFRLADAKDRSEFTLAVTCGEDGGVQVSTAESSTSMVLAAQAAALSTLAGTLAREAAAGALP